MKVQRQGPSSLDGTPLASRYSRFSRIWHCRLAQLGKPAVQVLLVVTTVLNPILLDAGDEGDECAMKVTFRQSGGYAGMIRGCELDTAAMEPAEAQRLQSLVNNSRILELGLKGEGAPKRPDLINYKFTIATGGTVHEISLDDLSITPTILPLLEYLQSCSGPRPPS